MKHKSKNNPFCEHGKQIYCEQCDGKGSQIEIHNLEETGVQFVCADFKKSAVELRFVDINDTIEAQEALKVFVEEIKKGKIIVNTD